MFYLINEKDGLPKEHGSILVNAHLLNILDSNITHNGLRLKVNFYFSNAEPKGFSFNKDDCFNVNAVMEKLSQLKSLCYSNTLLSFNDIENIESLKENQFYLHKFSKILVNFNNIALVYKNDNGGSVILTKETNIFIQETPDDVLNMINARILK